MKKIKAHVISHTHWDREWYMPYEKHHVKLVQLMDSLLDLLDRDPDFKSYHLDGQTIVLEDYLQIRPEMHDKLVKYIKEGRLFVGPWYVLQDEFLTSSEANIRNLLIGMRDAESFGAVTRIGYFPDAFGNIGQAPQILKQAGMKAAVFGRGVKPIGFDNQALECDRYESPFSEMYWQSPDGSKVLGILFANWYHNGMEIPVEEKEALAYWEGRIQAVEKFASTGQYLLMNGCDHQPVQRDLSKALAVAGKLFPEMEFVHSDFEQYVDSIYKSLQKPLTVVEGELRSQDTDGWWTLVNTASARVYLKQMNQECQVLLEKVAEPLAALAACLGYSYPYHLLNYGWKTLMQNHPHDSICGCSVDEVHREMVTRFEKSGSVAKAVQEEAVKQILESIDTSIFKNEENNSAPFAIFNTTGWERTGVVSAELDLQRKYGCDMTEAFKEMEKVDLGNWTLKDSIGNTIACTLEDLGTRFGYELPEDRFRQRYMARRVKVTFEAEKIPALGYKAYALVKQNDERLNTETLVTGPATMENGFVKVAIREDGSLDITEKNSGHIFGGLGVFEDVGDIGNEYIFVQPRNDVPVTTRGVKADIRLVEDTPFRAVYQITHRLEIPESADTLLQHEINSMVLCSERKAQRSCKTIQHKIETRVTLEKQGRGVRICTTFDNRAKDHRVRVLFPSGLITDAHYADSVFEVAKRSNQPSTAWKNPSNCQHQQAFVSIDDGRVGLTIANLGLNEYEVLRDESNTIAITLLRAVGELGDWGVFPTPEAQCLGMHTMEFEIIPHSGDYIRSGAFVEAYQYQVPWVTGQTTVHSGKIPAEYGLISWNAPSLALSGVKLGEAAGDLILRWFNVGMQECSLAVKTQMETNTVYLSNVIEQRVNDLQPQNGQWQVPVRKAEILTLGVRLKT